MTSESHPPNILRTYPHWFYSSGRRRIRHFLRRSHTAGLFISALLTRWTLFDATSIGFDNYERFFSDPQLVAGLRNTVIHATRPADPR
ncbi:MAG: sugar ABC transporter permease [Chloroflexi bacterium]|nr:sugar ABC transporter permease [Chloroflexota bacterium]